MEYEGLEGDLFCFWEKKLEWLVKQVALRKSYRICDEGNHFKAIAKSKKSLDGFGVRLLSKNQNLKIRPWSLIKWFGELQYYCLVFLIKVKR